MLSRRTYLAIASVVCWFIPAGLSAAQGTEPATRIYLAPDDHTDYVWTADEKAYEQAMLRMTEYYLKLADDTAGLPRNQQSRWNFDGSLWMWIWEKNRSRDDVERLVRRLRDGHFSMPLTAAASCYGATPTEAVLRGMYYAGHLERRYDLRFSLAVAMENQTLPLGLGALWAGSGARYSWRGVCACATQLQPTIKQPRPHEIYWWKGPDNSRVLMKWDTILTDNQSIGGYAEARNPTAVLRFVEQSPAFRKLYPYSIIGVFGKGWDDLETRTDEFVKAAAEFTTPDRQVIVSNEEDFFRDFEQRYGKDLPEYSAAFGNEWDLYSASMSEVSARVRRATERLRAYEAMATLVGLQQPRFFEGRDAARNEAWMALGLFWEHDWTADSPKLPRQVRADWQRKMAANVENYVNVLGSDAAAALGTMIARTGSSPRYFVFNPLSWERSDVADLTFAGSGPVRVVDLTTGNEVPSQWNETARKDGSARRVLRILAGKVPSLGYKVFEVRKGKGARFSSGLRAEGNTIENEYYRIRMNAHGAITSLISKRAGGRELAGEIDGRAINDFGAADGTLTVQNAGPISITLAAHIRGPLPRRTQVTLFRNSKRIDIQNEILASFSSVKTWAFSFNLKNPDVWHEEVGAINHARFQPEGDYSRRLSRLDWLTLNHFVAMSGDDGVGITLSNADTSFMKLGRSRMVDGISEFDTLTPQISVLAGGQVDGPKLGIPDQGGDTRFVQRFAINAFDTFVPATSMRFALEHQNPFATGAVMAGSAIYPDRSFSFLEISDPNVLVWALKPAEDGIDRGVIVRVWNLSRDRRTVQLAFPGAIDRASNATHIETVFGPAEFTGNKLTIEASPWQLQTVLVRLRR